MFVLRQEESRFGLNNILYHGKIGLGYIFYIFFIFQDMSMSDVNYNQGKTLCPK